MFICGWFSYFMVSNLLSFDNVNSFFSNELRSATISKNENKYEIFQEPLIFRIDRSKCSDADQLQVYFGR